MYLLSLTDCPANNVLIEDMCEPCPLFSSRLLTSSPDVCTCDENTVTANGNSETATDPCTGIHTCEPSTIILVYVYTSYSTARVL